MFPGAWSVLPCLRTAIRRDLPAQCFSAASQPQAYVACLEDVRGVVRLSGSGVLQFLQGLVTNDVSALERPGAPPLYSCILNAQGRYLHDMLLFRTPDSEPTLYLDTDSQGKADLIKLLKRYRLRQKIEIEDVSSQHAVWVQYGAAQQQASEPWQQDPRLQALGLRAILPLSASGELSASGGAGSLMDWRDYRRWRIQQGVAEGDSEIPTGDVIPLEYNVDGLSGISFTKGCYVGQELMARTHFKGVVRKRLMPFRLLSQPPAAGAAAGPTVQQGAEVFQRDDSGRYRSVGKVRVANGDVGLAMLRLAKVMPAIDAGRPLYVGSAGGGEGSKEEAAQSYVEVEVWRPEWWPEQWGREEQQAAGGGGED